MRSSACAGSSSERRSVVFLSSVVAILSPAAYRMLFSSRPCASSRAVPQLVTVLFFCFRFVYICISLAVRDGGARATTPRPSPTPRDLELTPTRSSYCSHWIRACRFCSSRSLPRIPLVLNCFHFGRRSRWFVPESLYILCAYILPSTKVYFRLSHPCLPGHGVRVKR